MQSHPGTLCDHTETRQGVFPVTSKVDPVITQSNSLLKFVSAPRKQRDLKTRDALNACYSFYTTTHITCGTFRNPARVRKSSEMFLSFLCYCLTALLEDRRHNREAAGTRVVLKKQEPWPWLSTCLLVYQAKNNPKVVEKLHTAEWKQV